MAMRIVTDVRQYLAAGFLIAIGLMASGCGDTASVNQGAQLASLTVTPGTLSPAFSGGTTQYNVQLDSNVSSVTVSAQPAVGGDTVTINNQVTTSSVIALGEAGTTTTASISVSGSGADPRTYVVSLLRAGLNGNNSLESLTVSPGGLDSPFNANDLSYKVDVANNVGSVTVTPTLSDTAATMTVNGQAANSGQARTVTLNPAGQDTAIAIVATAQNGNSKTYTVTVSRGVSSNNNLQSLALSPGTLNPTFSTNRTSYTVNVVSTVTSLTVTPRLQDATASMTVNGQATNSGQARPHPLGAPGSPPPPIFIVVTAQNGTQKTYTVGVNRAALGGNNNLSSLTVSQGTLEPNFNANTTNYTVDVASTVTSVTVTPREQDTAATTTVNGQATNSGQARAITLNGAGSNTLINIAVTAPNGNQKTYSVNVIRAAPGGNNNLSTLTVSPGTLDSAFSANDLNYTVNVGSNVTSVNVSATKADPSAVMSEDVTASAGTATGQATIQLGGPGTTTPVLISVTAPNGSSKTYRINVVKAALASNNNLSALSVTPGTLSPQFAAGRLVYAVNVATNVTNVTVTANKADSNAVISGDLPTQGQATIQLDGPGTSKAVSIIVTAPSGAQRTYTVTINRAAPASNNNLSALTVAPGSLSPAFAADTLGYTVNVASDVTSVAISATKADSNAVISGDVPNSGQANITLSGATTPVSVIVTAPNGASKTYTINIIRAEAATPPAKPATPDLISADDSCLLKFGLPVVTGTNDDCDPVTISTSNRDDNFTNVTTPRFAVSQPGPGLTPNLYVDGNKVSSTFNAGNSTLQPTTPLTGNNNGIQHSITSTVTNTSTNLESDQSDALTVTISTGQSGV